jgi:hypothetical protein
VTEHRPGLRKSYAAIFFAATWIALIIAIVFGVDTVALVLHAIAAGLGLLAVVIAWRPPPRSPEGPV